MKERSDWMEGLLWAENRIKNRSVKTIVAEAEQLKWELLYSGVYGSVEDEEFVEGGLDYLGHLEASLNVKDS